MHAKLTNKGKFDIEIAPEVVLKSLSLFEFSAVITALAEHTEHDKTRYLDAIPMNYTSETVSVHNDEMPHGTTPDFFDFMVRSEKLSEETIYFEIEYIPNELSNEIDDIISKAFKLTEETNAGKTPC